MKIPQSSILGLLIFLIYINYVSDDLSITVKIFINDTSPFSATHDIDTSVNGYLINDLEKITTRNNVINGKYYSNQDLFI